MHNAAYRAIGLDWDYGFMDCATEREARDFFETGTWLACNVTMPWKPLAFEYADERTVESVLARGSNVLVRWNGRLFADNTDGKGCVSYLRRCGVAFNGATVAVCGTGPTSLAIMHACVKAGASGVLLYGRSLAHVQDVVASYRSAVCAQLQAAEPPDALDAQPPAVSAAQPSAQPPAEVAARTYDAMGQDDPSHADVIVDATPLGMKPGDPAPFDVGVLAAGQTVFDVVYGHGETALMAAARKAGCNAYDGEGMLVAQAVETVRDISLVTGLFQMPDDGRVFSAMAEAAGFARLGSCR